MLPELFFGYFAAAIIIFSLIVVTRRNPVHSVLFMLILFFHIAALYLFLDAEFLAAIQVIVYAGAILVLFLFVVLLLNLKEETLIRRYINQWPMGVVFAVGLFILMFISVRSFLAGPKGEISSVLTGQSNVTNLGTVLYTEYLFPFEIASLVLLVAIIGAIVLAKKRLKS
jgi:NADH-quinone oxidoreductase subunit J